MIRRPPRSTHSSSSAASDVYKRQPPTLALACCCVAVYLVSYLKYSLAVALCPDLCPQIFCSCCNSYGFLSSNIHPLLEVYSLFPSQILLNCCTLFTLPLQNSPLLAVPHNVNYASTSFEVWSDLFPQIFLSCCT